MQALGRMKSTETMERITRQKFCDNFDEILDRVDKEDKGEGTINTVVWDKICRTLNCDVSDILEIVPYGS